MPLKIANMISKIYKPAPALLSLITPEQKKGAILCLIVMLLLSFVEIVAASLIVMMAAQITSNNSDTDSLAFLAIICLVVFVAKGAIALYESYVQNKWTQALILDFKERLIRRYMGMDYAHQVTLKSGDSLSVLYNDADIYMRIGFTSMGILFSEASVFIVLMCFLFYMQPVITLVLLGMFSILGIIFVMRLIPVFKKWGKTVHKVVQAGYKAALQILQSYKDILIFGKSDHFISIYMEQSAIRAQVAVKAAVSQVIPRVSLEIVFISFFTGLVLSFLWLGNDIASLTAVLSTYLYAGFRLLPGLNRMVIQVNNIKMSEASIDRVVTELSSNYHKGVYLSNSDLSFNNEIVVSGVSFSYPESDKITLKDVDFKIQKGEFIGIIGETGSGKSTLLHLLLGLLLPSYGEILIDGKYPANSIEWHSKIGYAAQNFHLIDGSVAGNIAFGVPVKEYDYELIDKVIKDAKLDRFISSLPDGINTEIGEKGALISGGERQRIALARALYQQPEVLMLDEATSALDLETEKLIMNAIVELKKSDLTIIAVTHRLDTLKMADRVLVVDNGCIVKEIKGADILSVSKDVKRKIK